MQFAHAYLFIIDKSPVYMYTFKPVWFEAALKAFTGQVLLKKSTWVLRGLMQRLDL